MFGATQPEETTAREVAFLARVLPLPVHRAVLDVCCGSGRHLAALTALGYDGTGIERDPTVAQEARNAAPLARVIEGDANRLADLVADPFGGIVCIWQSFGYGTSAENARLLRTMTELLAPTGRIVLDVYNRAFLESRTGARTLERAGLSIRERTQLVGDRLTSMLDYGSGIEDSFSWQVFTLEDLVALAGSLELEPVLACATFDEAVPPSAEHARMQIVLHRGGV